MLRPAPSAEQALRTTDASDYSLAETGSYLVYTSAAKRRDFISERKALLLIEPVPETQ